MKEPGFLKFDFDKTQLIGETIPIWLLQQPLFHLPTSDHKFACSKFLFHIWEGEAKKNKSLSHFKKSKNIRAQCS